MIVMTPELVIEPADPVPVLAPEAGRTRTGRLLTYVRDERGSGGDAPPAMLFRDAPDRKAERPAQHLRAFRGDLHADGYAGFDRLYGERIAEVARWAHVRRKLHDVHVATGSVTAREALDHIAGLYAVEGDVRGRPPGERRRERQARAGPLLDALRRWLDLTKLARRSDLATGIRYALARWPALTRYVDDGRLDNYCPA